MNDWKEVGDCKVLCRSERKERKVEAVVRGVKK